MESDPALQLIDHDLSYDTNEFLSRLISLAISSPDYNAVLKRFLVLSMTLTKVLTSSHHELLALEIMDMHNNGSPPYLMFLERTKSDKQPDPTNSFLKHPDSTTVLESIVDTLKEIPTTLLSSVPAMSDSEDESSLHSPPDSPHISPSDPLLGSLSTSSPSPSDQSNRSILRNLVDSGTLISIKAVQASAESTGKFKIACARDQFTGGKDAGISADALGQVIWQIRPQCLTLFELAILADVVHTYAPLYSLFKRQCYWFVSIICAVILRTRTCTSVSPPGLRPSSDNICIPPNSYLPDLAGRWKGILVSRVEETVLKIMIDKFEACCAEKQTVVRFMLILSNTY
jgi:hypothetical protein